ncbi:MAG TPA: chemotaxis protein CheB [Chthoniobacteraceae bacterium]|jgi:two-component system chemotaxis response regulator CheB|nr:chemotaxis protein CheB [Chthoniobacteraceae bacterium]
MNRTPAITKPRLVVIGASAGGVEALLTLLPPLPEDYPIPILVVVHRPPRGDGMLQSLLSSQCALRVKEAEDKEDILPGVVYLAPANYHLLVEPNFRLSLSSEEPVNFSRPSIDLLFETAADACGASAVGFILTGANADGARGLARICAAGGLAYVQSPSDAQSDAMPAAALDACPTAAELDLQGLKKALKNDLPVTLQ